jgi:hypothetical protein
MDEERWVYILGLDAVVRVIVSLDNSHTQCYDIFYVASVDSFVKVVPR